jgi:aminopeptidase N
MRQARPGPRKEEPVPRVRLPADLRPTYYDLALEVVPERESFSGTALIAVELDRPHRALALHGLGLKVGLLEVRDEIGRRVEATLQEPESDGFLELDLARPLGPGPATLRFEYEAPFNLQLEGLYRVETGGRAYAFTQFQSISARLAFPCFDEPAFKTPFDVALTVRADHVAVANTLAVSEELLPDGLKRVRFARTERLPTYVLAWAVGPLDVVEAPQIRPEATRTRPLPLRGVAPRGRGPELQYALEHAPAQVLALERYLGLGYPFDKLDLIAVPDFAAGAMENPGAITFRDSLLLLHGEGAPEDQKRAFADVLAHELAHMWFGDLVTMPWWDDTWLNEAFASWMGNRVLQELYPQYHAGVWMLEVVQGAMQLDGLGSARQIRQPVESVHDIENAFDPITYDKGMALLAMFERWLGAETFQRGIRLYLERHRFATAVAEDWTAALSEAAARDAAEPFESFLHQPGVPLVEAEVRRRDGGAVLSLRQSRFLPIGSQAAREQTWHLPICVRYSDGASEKAASVLLGGPDGELALEGDPAWVLPNADGAGYYRWSLAADDLRQLERRGWGNLTARERLSFADSVSAAFETAKLPAAEIFEALWPLAEDETRAVAVSPMRLVRFAWNYLLDEELRPAVEAFGRALYRPLLARLGWETGPEESAEPRLLRQEVLEFLAFVGHDREVRAEAEQRGRAYLGLGGDGRLHPEAMEAGLVTVCVSVAVQAGGAPVFDEALRHLIPSEAGILRSKLLWALGSTPEPMLAARARELTLDGRLRVNEALMPLERQRENEATREAAWEWLKANFDAVVARIGRLRAGTTPELASRFCTRAQARDVETFFAPRINQLTGGPRNLALVLERIELTAARIEAQAESARSFFAQWTAGATVRR